ncbi:ABC-three component system middle component 2 [Xenorhabdus sp. PB61.4]|uniref:ABC-three component system middle component 2 n=1 Tax=Xenorhabdus sp. PB61.4 TaxID=2788940 RepID=UPI001E2D1FB8
MQPIIEISEIERHFEERPFNSPLEYGFRALFILYAAGNMAMVLQRIVSYDYLLVHTSDVQGGPKSLHPAVPHRGAELLVKRSSIQAGLNLMLSRELIEAVFSPEGILYQASELTGRFVQLLASPYANELAERALWVTKQFRHFSNDELASFMTQNVGRWGSEFDRLTAIDLLEL